MTRDKFIFTIKLLGLKQNPDASYCFELPGILVFTYTNTPNTHLYHVGDYYNLTYKDTLIKLKEIL